MVGTVVCIRTLKSQPGAHNRAHRARLFIVETACTSTGRTSECRMRSTFENLKASLFLSGPTVDHDRLLNSALLLFFLRLLFAVARHRHMLYPRYGRMHRLVGMVLLLYLVAGMIDARACPQVLRAKNLWTLSVLRCFALLCSALHCIIQATGALVHKCVARSTCGQARPSPE